MKMYNIPSAPRDAKKSLRQHQRNREGCLGRTRERTMFWDEAKVVASRQKCYGSRVTKKTFHSSRHIFSIALHKHLGAFNHNQASSVHIDSFISEMSHSIIALHPNTLHTLTVRLSAVGGAHSLSVRAPPSTRARSKLQGV